VIGIGVVGRWNLESNSRRLFCRIENRAGAFSSNAFHFIGLFLIALILEARKIDKIEQKPRRNNAIHASVGGDLIYLLFIRLESGPSCFLSDSLLNGPWFDDMPPMNAKKVVRIAAKNVASIPFL